jgi:hypothetical protein
VLIRAQGGRAAEVLGLYAGMNTEMDQICAGYPDRELELLARFLRRTADAGRTATAELAAPKGRAEGGAAPTGLRSAERGTSDKRRGKEAPLERPRRRKEIESAE